VVDERSRIGDWENDTLASRQSKTRVKSINERMSGLFSFIKTPNSAAEACDKATLR